MKVFKADQIRNADQYTIDREPIKSIDLMERAASAFTDWFVGHYDKKRPVNVFCGTGNNGGDGMAISRMLLVKGWEVETYVVRKSGKQSDDFKINFLKLGEVIEVRSIEYGQDMKEVRISNSDIIIDAIFGSGLTRPVEGIYAEVIDLINQSGAEVVSVDIPSGLFCDDHSTGNAIVEADQVVSFQLPKMAFLLPENSHYVKSWTLADIGLSKEFILQEPSDFEYVERSLVKKMLKTRDKFSHKTNYGRVLLITGSRGKMGASVLSAKACLRIGAGLVTVHAPICGYQILQTAVPEAMVSVDFGEINITSAPEVEQYSTIGIGPGIGQHFDTFEVLSQVISNARSPMVIDADAINIIAQERDFMKMLPQGSILTPHPGEFKRIVGFWEDDYDRLEQQMAYSKDFGIYIVLKGAHTSVSTPDGKVYFNSTGNPGMATGGSGDVLTGIITGLLAQHYQPLEASVLGVYIHGLAGDLASLSLGEESMIASDIIDYLPRAYQKLKMD